MEKWIFFANWAQGDGQSGGDTILINFAKFWAKQKNIFIEMITSESGKFIFERAGAKESEKILYRIISSKKYEKFGMFFLYSIRTLSSIWEALRRDFSSYTYIYSSSDFWPDSIAGLIIKFRHPKIKWVASVYLFAPNPFFGFKENQKKLRLPSLKDTFYYITQRPVIFFTKKFADKICITSEPDIVKIKNPRCGVQNIVVVKGGVDTTPSNPYINKQLYLKENKNLDACFIGRFHRQKGVVELIDIWKKLTDERPEAKLAVIGDGPLMNDVKKKITAYKLQNNIELCGVLTGENKYKLFKRAKIVLHPAVYDSGGMAAAEAMAFGLPAVGFNLKAFDTYYPRGMIKARPGDFNDFVAKIKILLDNKEVYTKFQTEAISLVQNMWDFEKRAEHMYLQFKNQ